MSWKGVQGGKPEGEERMRGSALSSPMGVPLGLFSRIKTKDRLFRMTADKPFHTISRFR